MRINGTLLIIALGLVSVAAFNDFNTNGLCDTYMWHQQVRCSNITQYLGKMLVVVPEDTDSLILEEIDWRTNELSEDQFIKFKNLTSLYLARNVHFNIDNNAFRGLTKLNSIHISDSLSKLPVGLLNNNPNIQYAKFPKNTIESIQKGVFYNLPYLKEINLFHNRIFWIAPNSFEKLPQLYEIQLAENLLSTLSLNILDNPNTLTKFYLSGNVWNCDERLCEVMDIVVNHRLYDPSVNVSIPSCNSPSADSGRKWTDVWPHIGPCNTTRHMCRCC